MGVDSNYEAAREEIMKCSGSQFDPQVVKHLLKVPAERWEEIRRRTLFKTEGPTR